MNTIPLSDVNSWAQGLGLFPVPLYANVENSQQFVLLNGMRGNFCLDLSPSELGEQTRSLAWSSNVGHYVSVTGDKVEVQRWDNPGATIERYNRERVYNSLEAFHSYLEKDSPKQDISIISHAVRVFRRLRATLGRGQDGLSALRAFLYLIACSKDGVDRNQLVLNNWRVDPEAKTVALSISEANWANLLNDLASGRPLERLRPDLTLMLRHASGQLFEEAHYEATFGPQLALDGFFPSLPSIRRNNQDVGIHFTPSWLVQSSPGDLRLNSYGYDCIL